MTEDKRDSGQGHVPEDIASLYSWANVPETKYRDFSASRRETRAQFRHRMLREQAESASPAPEPGKEKQFSKEHPSPQELPISSASLEEESDEERASRSNAAFQDSIPPVAQPRWLEVPAASKEIAAVSEDLSQPQIPDGPRWFALNGFFAPEAETPPVPRAQFRSKAAVPALAVFSVAGGAGKTSLVATLGRVLAGRGENVLLADTTSSGLLPFYFGSRELKPGMARTFSPPAGTDSAPIHAVALEFPPAEEKQDRLLEQIYRQMRGAQRLLIDLPTAATSLLARLLPLAPAILVPLLPDMNSVVSLRSIEAAFSGWSSADGRAIAPTYLLNQFDPSSSLHLEVQEILRRSLGAHLLPFVLRRSPAVNEALAEGMTVMDYAPDTPVAKDYLRLAKWLRNGFPAAAAGSYEVRWSEQ